MAINITNNTFNAGEIKGVPNSQISINQAYIRLTVSLIEKGNKLRIRHSIYYSKDYYNSGITMNLNLDIPKNINYNRDVDGTDILEVAHNKVVDKLVESGIDESNIEIVDINLS